MRQRRYLFDCQRLIIHSARHLYETMCEPSMAARLRAREFNNINKIQLREDVIIFSFSGVRPPRYHVTYL